MKQRTLPGVLLIAQERAEQIFKHGYDLQHDFKHFSIEVFKAAVISILEMNYNKWPKDSIPLAVGQKIIQGTNINRLTKAGAFIAAAIDYIQYREAIKLMPIRGEQDESDYLAPIMDSMASFMPVESNTTPSTAPSLTIYNGMIEIFTGILHDVWVNNFEAGTTLLDVEGGLLRKLRHLINNSPNIVTEDTYNLLPIMHEAPEPDTTIKGVIQRMEWLINQTPTGSTLNTLCDANLYLHKLKFNEEPIAVVDGDKHQPATKEYKTVDIGISPDALRSFDPTISDAARLRIEGKIKEWHSLDDPQPLHQYLGMSVKEYNAFVAATEAVPLNIERSPLGVRPQYIVVSDRIDEITSAVASYAAASKGVPGEWIAELRSLLDWQHNNGHSVDTVGYACVIKLGGYTLPKVSTVKIPAADADLHLTVDLQSKVNSLLGTIQAHEATIDNLTNTLSSTTKKRLEWVQSVFEAWLQLPVTNSAYNNFIQYLINAGWLRKDSKVKRDNSKNPYYIPDSAYDAMKAAYLKYREIEDDCDADTFAAFVEKRFKLYENELWANDRNFISGAYDVYLDKCTEHGVAAETFKGWIRSSLSAISLMPWIRKTHADYVRSHKGGTDTEEGIISLSLDKWLEDKLTPAPAVKAAKQMPTVKAELTPEEIETTQLINAKLRNLYFMGSEAMDYSTFVATYID